MICLYYVLPPPDRGGGGVVNVTRPLFTPPLGKNWNFTLWAYLYAMGRESGKQQHPFPKGYDTFLYPKAGRHGDL